MMSRKQFIEIADMIGEVWAEIENSRNTKTGQVSMNAQTVFDEFKERLIRFCSSENSRFNRNRFIDRYIKIFQDNKRG